MKFVCQKFREAKSEEGQDRGLVYGVFLEEQNQKKKKHRRLRNLQNRYA